MAFYERQTTLAGKPDADLPPRFARQVSAICQKAIISSNAQVPMKKDVKQRLFDIYAQSAQQSGYSGERVYFCPLCARQFRDAVGLSEDHVPFKALGLRSLKVLTCNKCNSNSGTAQDRLLQAHLLHRLASSGPTEPHSIRVTLKGLTVNARSWKDQRGVIQLHLDPKGQNPKMAKAFIEAYEAEQRTTEIDLSSVVRLDEPLIRWALVREGYLLFFYHWGFWLLREGWAPDVQRLLNDPHTLLHSGSVVHAPNLRFKVDPTKGEFLWAQTPSGQRCWLIPVIDDRCLVMPLDDPSQSCISLWDDMERAAEEHLPITGVVKVRVHREVKIASAWVIVKYEEASQVPDFWIEILPATSCKPLL